MRRQVGAARDKVGLSARDQHGTDQSRSSHSVLTGLILTCLDALRKTDLSRYMHREPISSEPPPARRQVGQDRSDDLSQPG
jgi:hypothetical protein